MRRGEIRLTDFDPTLGSEAKAQRPAVIVSNDAVNAATARSGRGVITVVPVTINVERVRSFQVLLPAGSAGLQLDSKAQAEQLRSLSVTRVGAMLGVVPGHLLAELDDALRLHLDL